MHDTSERYLLQIEPKNQKEDFPVNNDLTKKMDELMLNCSRPDPHLCYRGVHRCVCGELSTNFDIKIDKYITNSLAAHYLRWHRNEVPASEIEKLRAIQI